MPSENVDINVHPTKNEVHFLDEEHIVKHIHSVFTDTLRNAINSRKLPVVSFPNKESILCVVSSDTFSMESYFKQKALTAALDMDNTSTVKLKTNTTKFVRSVMNQNKIKSFFTLGEKEQASLPCDGDCCKGDKIFFDMCGKQSCNDERRTGFHSSVALIGAIERSTDVDFSETLKNSVFIGTVDEIFSVIQSGNNIWLVDNLLLMESLFYQILIKSGGELYFICPTFNVKILPLINFAIDGFDNDISNGLQFANILIKNRKILNDYFALCISADGELLSVPLVLKDVQPSNEHIPLLLLSIAANVHWDDDTE